ncbi:MAG: ABC transporter ATP-binding protein [Candidatus Dadabacteria bacterium]|nr:ABC transporter ATP-binding protein [Candidatus Dadabacteria bacterium]
MRILEIENLKKSYKSPDGEIVKVIDVPEFALESGEQIALSGESGSGKTTFLNLVAGILRPDGGRISLCGEDVTALSEAGRDRRRADKIGYIFQTFNLLQGYTALENVLLGMMFGKGTDREFALGLLERVGLGNRAGYKPAQLSVGQQQRVALARALANRPALVLADEPTGNLDARTAGIAAALIKEMCAENGAALLLVSHDSNVLGDFAGVKDLGEINRASCGGIEK